MAAYGDESRCCFLCSVVQNAESGLEFVVWSHPSFGYYVVGPTVRMYHSRMAHISLTVT